MKHYLLAFFTVSTLFAFASGDTLTRAEVYDFSVGDTFDYRITKSTVVDAPNPPSSTSSISYSRFVISDIYWSSDSLTKYIVRQKLYPTPVVDETLTLTNLSGNEVILDMALATGGFGSPEFIINSCPAFFGKTANQIRFPCCTPGWHTMRFAKGLGNVIDDISAGAMGHYSGTTTELIYYSSATEKLGTPYTSQPLAIEDLTLQEEKIKVFSIDNNSAFTIAIPDEIQLPLTFSVYDVQGKKVRDLILPDKKNEFDVQELSKGLYIWKAASKEKFIQSGKVIK